MHAADESDEGTLIRFGVRSFKPKLRKAAEHLGGLRTPEGEGVPPETQAELLRDMARLRLVKEQIKAIEAARLERLKQAPAGVPCDDPPPGADQGSAPRRPTCWSTRCSRASCATAGR